MFYSVLLDSRFAIWPFGRIPEFQTKLSVIEGCTSAPTADLSRYFLSIHTTKTGEDQAVLRVIDVIFGFWIELEDRPKFQ